AAASVDVRSRSSPPTPRGPSTYSHLVLGRRGTGRSRTVSVPWDFSGTSGCVSEHERETTEIPHVQVSGPQSANAASHGPACSLPGHLTDGCRRAQGVLHGCRTSRGAST